jgi:hypothetical protein
MYIMKVGQHPFHPACSQFAQGVAFMTQGEFGEAYQSLCEAYDLTLALDENPDNADTAYVDLFRTAAVVAAGQYDHVATKINLQAAQGMLSVWEGCKSLELGNELYHQHGRLVPEALAHYQQAVLHLEEGISLLEAGLGTNHPELAMPLNIYIGALRTVGRETDADVVESRSVALPPTTVNNQLHHCGTIFWSDPFGEQPLPDY